MLRGDSFEDIGGFNNPHYNQLVDRADTTFEPRLHARLYREAQHIAVGTGAFIPLDETVEVAMVSPRVHGFVASPALGVVPRNADWSTITAYRTYHVMQEVLFPHAGTRRHQFRPGPVPAS